MKIGVISDSHGILENIHRAMEELKDVDLIIHAGDHYRDALYIEKNYNKRVLAVAGNCDAEDIEEQVEVLENRKILITHGHKYGVKSSIHKIFYAGKEGKADIIIFGHSHMPFYAVEEEMILLNPGSISFPRGGSQRSCAIIHMDQDIKVSFIYL